MPRIGIRPLLQDFQALDQQATGTARIDEGEMIDLVAPRRRVDVQFDHTDAVLLQLDIQRSLLIGVLPDQRKGRSAVVAVVGTLHLQMVQAQSISRRVSNGSGNCRTGCRLLVTG
jgi:hypothetical protein